jgi:hypothetical protein
MDHRLSSMAAPPGRHAAACFLRESGVAAPRDEHLTKETT